MTNDIHTAVLSALCDGEPVDPDALAAALDDPAARRALVDFVRLRQAIQLEPPGLPDSLERLRQDRQRFLRTSVPLPAVAALVLLVLFGALTLPRPWRAADDTPPTPTRVIEYVPGVDWHSTR